MATETLYFATNRRHEGDNRWSPVRYGREFSANGHYNLRFGQLHLKVDAGKMKRLADRQSHGRAGDGNALAEYLTERAKNSQNMVIEAAKENLDSLPQFDDLSSTHVFSEIQQAMKNTSDVLVFIHGYNVTWEAAVGSALGLQYMMNRTRRGGVNAKKVLVFLFSWPSEGRPIPFIDYWSDRDTAVASGPAVGRAILKLHQFLVRLSQKAQYHMLSSEGAVPSKDLLCGQEIHLLCHSMGNYVLENALATVLTYAPGHRLPRLFQHVFLCAADVDEDVLNPGHPMSRLHELTRQVTVYFNRGDLALHISDKTKGNPDRLGQIGFSPRADVHDKVQQVDCSEIVKGAVEHSYYLWATVNNDIRFSIDGLPLDAKVRRRGRVTPNTWALE